MSVASSTWRMRLARSRIGRLLQCKSGMAAVEFGYIAPIMFVMFLGSVEFSQALTVDRRVSQVAAATADIVARQRTVTTAQMDTYMGMVSQILSPYDENLLYLTVSNVFASASNATDTRVCWSYNRNDSGTTRGVNSYSANQTYTLPTGLLEAGTSVIVVEVRYDYAPLFFHYFITTTKQLTEKFYLKPRLSASVQYNGAAACV